jgi:hypothetical protein
MPSKLAESVSELLVFVFLGVCANSSSRFWTGGGCFLVEASTGGCWFDDDEQEIPEKTAEQHLTFVEVS